MSTESPDLRQLALQVSKSFDTLSIACYQFEETVKQRFEKETCENCKDILDDLLGGMAIIKPILVALAKTFQFFNFNGAALEAIAINQLEHQLNSSTEQYRQNEQN